MKLEKEVYINKVNGIHDKDTGKVFTTLDIVFCDLLTKEEISKLNKVKLILKIEEPILDDAERKYLSGVIRPFRDRVVGIYKYNSVLNDYEEIAIDTFEDYNCSHVTHLPPFKKGSMHKNMELNKEYTLKELGL